ncbi:MAG: hypothetical protein MHM6MM_008000 [Cercozoa sp. M6MM]
MPLLCHRNKQGYPVSWLLIFIIICNIGIWSVGTNYPSSAHRYFVVNTHNFASAACVSGSSCSPDYPLTQVATLASYFASLSLLLPTSLSGALVACAAVVVPLLLSLLTRQLELRWRFACNLKRETAAEKVGAPSEKNKDSRHQRTHFLGGRLARTCSSIRSPLMERPGATP